MARIQEASVDLVLHGHKHHPYACKISYRSDAQDTMMVGAGTACQAKSERPSFCVIDLYPLQQVKVTFYEWSEQRFASIGIGPACSRWGAVALCPVLSHG